MALDDPRVEWIRNRVCSAFFLPKPNCFEEMLSRGDGEEEQKIIQFLNQVTDEEATSALLFFKRIREEEVEVTVPNGAPQPDEDKAEANHSSLSHPGTETPTSERQMSAAEKRKGLESSEGHRRESSYRAESAAEGTLEAVTVEERPSTVRTEVQIVYHVELHVAVNSIPDKSMKSNVLYFLRNTKETIVEPVDINEANDLMPKLLEIGMLNGHSLLMLRNLLKHVCD